MTKLEQHPMPTEPTASDAERATEIEARLNAATPGPWKVYENPMEWSAEGKAVFDDAAPLTPEFRIGTAGDHPQLKAPLPVVTAADRPYCVDQHGVSMQREDAEFIAHAPDDIRWLISDRAALVKRVEELEAENDRITGPDCDALEVLCRVFDDGADEGYAEWLAWYKPSEWLHPSRALGAFIYGRLLAKRSFTPFEREAIDSLSQAMQMASGRLDGNGKVN